MLIVLVALLVITTSVAERCPQFFGEFECPVGFACKNSQCYGIDGNISMSCSTEMECTDGTVCVEGKCYPLSSIKCNRFLILVISDLLESYVRFCDNILHCIMIMRGQRLFQNSSKDFRTSCQPNEICHRGQCYPNNQCTSIYCGKGSYCVDGKCINAIGLSCSDDICRGGTVCVNGVCVLDPCPDRCPVDQSCRLGECRIMEGLPCISECSGSFLCIDGRCRRNGLASYHLVVDSLSKKLY
ncbi:hypothetical protein DICVIV_00471 [Dictyocaulus viviparus]|uniref:EB module n=1 Tax=Dictyocaulus viviparus TaxID=29172 RepID=A0A0D8Y937_DICVI|nr:hypothetical protein DICVIV_00471 [Dictyocaulus viviparus]